MTLGLLEVFEKFIGGWWVGCLILVYAKVQVLLTSTLDFGFGLGLSLDNYVKDKIKVFSGE